MKLLQPKKMIKKIVGICIIAGVTAFSTSCKNETRDPEPVIDPSATTDTTANRQVEVRTFVGDITTLNKEANGGTEVSGTVSLRVEGDLMRITVNAEGLSEDMMHLQHLQTSQSGEDTNCPGDNADKNNDQIVDVTEVTDESRGFRIIPLNMGPSTLQVNVDTYPRTNINGALQFQRTLSLDSLRTAVKEEYGMDGLDFTRFTYIIQGVDPEATSVPASTKSVADVPAYASIPVGCAKLEEANIE